MDIRVRLPMQASLSLLLCFACVAGTNAQAVAARAPVDSARGVLSYSDLIQPVVPAIVSVHATGMEPARQLLLDPELKRFFGDMSVEPKKRKQAGTGFIVDAAAGLIVTASFVLDDAKAVSVTLHDGRMVDATVVASDAESQIGLLRIKPEALPALTWGDSKSAKVGDVVFAIGHPYDLGRTVTAGIVSGFSQGDERMNYRDMIITDAGIARGYAGGPLIDSKGRVIGIAVAIFASGNDLQLSFAVPSSDAQRVVKDLIAFGRVKRASLGVQLTVPEVDQDLEDGLQVQPSDVVVREIVPGSSAERAGLVVGDVIVRAGGIPMKSGEDLRALVQQSEIGTPIEIVYRRKGSERTVTIALGEAQP